MKNQIYRLQLSDDYKLEIYVCDTNEINPHRHTKELGVVILKDGQQIDGGLDEASTNSLIKFLKKSNKSISKFNKKSKPTNKKTQ